MAKKDNNKYINNTKKSCKPKESQSRNTSSRNGLIIGCTAVAVGVGAVLTAPIAIAAAGFGTVGIAAGSLGASMMSWAATHGFGMAVVSALQSAGAAGIGLSANALIGLTGAAVGGGAAAAVGAAVGGNAGEGEPAVDHSDESDDENEDDMPSSALHLKKL